MKLIVGLGNPGYEYHLTPHNLGFMAVDRLAEICRAEFSRREARAKVAPTRFHGEQVILAKPQTFMNLSGASVSGLLRNLDVPVEDLIVLVDDVNLPLGTVRVRSKGSAGGHNGLKSVIGALETEHFTRIRMGAGPGNPAEDLVTHVLSPFCEKDQEMVAGMVDRTVEAIRVILKEGVEKAMNLFNRKVQAEEQ
ncbi:MAG: aminoacyl-tRNA hydrolase [Acidobacteria bacterium]|nr:MAG: aminoacyl-tRNA hydrolase [Acidobacteriota bacterium]